MIKILIVEDDIFVNSMLKQILEAADFSVTTALNVAQALASISEVEPNLILTDLDLGNGPNGADLINKISIDYPWINFIVLSTHRNPKLAIYPHISLPEGIIYITKSDLVDKNNLVSIVKESMTSNSYRKNVTADDLPILNSQQAEVLQLIAKGLSNQAIADIREVSLRAVEISITKIYEILGINNDPTINTRLKAAEIWRNGKVLTI
jgi:DNA-binding NarL/FixJ family response regulator